MADVHSPALVASPSVRPRRHWREMTVTEPMFLDSLSMLHNPETHHLCQKARIHQESDKLGGNGGRKSLGAARYPLAASFAAVPAHWGLTPPVCARGGQPASYIGRHE
jgi:hypothetical protein